MGALRKMGRGWDLVWVGWSGGKRGGGKRGGTVPVRVSEGERDGNINLLKYTAGVQPGVGWGEGA